MTFSEENYLKSIYALQKEHPKGVSTNVLSKYLDTKPASATEMIKKLDEKGLVHYQPYQGVILKDSGAVSALKIIRKHRLWETFLANKLDFSWDEIHDVAEQLEHIKSDKLIRELDKFLGYPKHDPHGDPIPDEEGNVVKMEKKRVSQLNPGDIGTCIGVNDTSSSFLQFLDQQNIRLGSVIHILSVQEFDKSMTVRIDDRELLLSQIATEHIYVRV
ncbi:metal-dependent transcriptional regulator [Leeuwenhoekiella palythoae]|uniref:Transcriptional regulator MntR n=1 Tax=Leeuwenhoekiella palythoae TaxID=573501 RepID=A0A1M5VMD8_9FLAO|nr:metal-dependent transcriptional regulator [Leeuwenhoekiella palythoae]MEC7785025.1 metal-dependent transcriptional regulator [Bacteroidota bacterium]MEC8683760.1 metal-dependent transcriptional regulator [Bacteroidota bacterium]RXG30971.1 DtxR family iron (metal) dependent repressor [Leeuwenhoekiella palythoae]SHH76370.1 iron (metal) dependent repressor, DtxR family [Leeuwenhoekiella palythoae]